MDGLRIIFLVFTCAMSGFCQEDSMIERCNDAVIEMKEIRAQIEDALADTITAAGNLTDANCSSTETAGNSFTEVVEKLEKISDNLNATADKLVTLHQSALHRVWPGLDASDPADSCTEILDFIPNAPSCNYWLRSSNESVMQVFCNMTLFPCQPGFSEEGATCEDVDECTVGSHNCDAQAVCANTVGSFLCTCQTGYTGDGVTCNDIDECASDTDNCHANAVCTNRIGSFTCQCQSGYTGDGVICDDINECTVGTDNCHARAVCTNTIGSFTCTCQSGYAGNGVICSDINECAIGTDNCHSRAMCTNTHGSFMCNCRSGYSGNGVTYCDDVNECATGTHNCDADARCTNTVGSYYCTCISGYTGNGITCTLQWPNGRYSLPQATQPGCPTGWSSGYVHQDNEDSRNANVWSPSDLHVLMRIDLGTDYTTHYCSKTSYGGSGPSHWPSGRYCIARYGGSCPSGFSNGKIVWDDEDDNNVNSRQGSIPDGEYDTNTRIHYCCRSDGSTSVGMRLPTSQPFILYRYGGTCQQVRGMTVKQLHVHFDDEDSNGNDNSCSGSHPDDSSCDRDHDLYFCYYS